MVTIDIYLHPISWKFVSSAHAFIYRIWGGVVALIGQVKEFVVVYYLEPRREVWCGIFAWLMLYKIATPVYLAPCFIVRHTIQLYRLNIYLLSLVFSLLNNSITFRLLGVNPTAQEHQEGTE